MSRTIEQILEGVTAGGQWRTVTGYDLRGPDREEPLSGEPLLDESGDFFRRRDAAYAAWAARNAPGLARALERLIHGSPESFLDDLAAAKTVLAEALKD